MGAAESRTEPPVPADSSVYSYFAAALSQAFRAPQPIGPPVPGLNQIQAASRTYLHPGAAALWHIPESSDHG